MKKIIVYCEADLVNKKLEEVSFELISKARSLTKTALDLKNEEYQVEAVVLCDEINEESVKKAYKAGAHIFTLIKNDSLKVFYQTVFAQSFVEYFNQNKSDIIIFPATPKGRIVAPRITTSLDCGLVADCTGLDFIVRDDKLMFAPTRPTFGSELMATIISKTLPQCATVRPKTFSIEFIYEEKNEINLYEPVSYEENRMKLVKTVLDNAQNEYDFTNANIVLACGYGLVHNKDRKYFEKLEKIAKLIGAKVGSTRKVVDLGYMPQATQIGQTGSTVEAQIYVAFGISGALQHISGMKNSKKIVAVNIDEDAEIFKYSDYKIVANAKSIIDKLYDELSK